MHSITEKRVTTISPGLLIEPVIVSYVLRNSGMLGDTVIVHDLHGRIIRLRPHPQQHFIPKVLEGLEVVVRHANSPEVPDVVNLLSRAVDLVIQTIRRRISRPRIARCCCIADSAAISIFLPNSPTAIFWSPTASRLSSSANSGPESLNDSSGILRSSTRRAHSRALSSRRPLAALMFWKSAFFHARY